MRSRVESFGFDDRAVARHRRECSLQPPRLRSSAVRLHGYSVIGEFAADPYYVLPAIAIHTAKGSPAHKRGGVPNLTVEQIRTGGGAGGARARRDPDAPAGRVRSHDPALDAVHADARPYGRTPRGATEKSRNIGDFRHKICAGTSTPAAWPPLSRSRASGFRNGE